MVPYGDGRLMKPVSEYADCLDSLCASLAEHMPENGDKYRIAWISKTHCRVEWKESGVNARLGWRPLRKGLGFLDKKTTYWMLNFAIEMIEHKKELERGTEPFDV